MKFRIETENTNTIDRYTAEKLQYDYDREYNIAREIIAENGLVLTRYDASSYLETIKERLAERSCDINVNNIIAEIQKDLDIEPDPLKYPSSHYAISHLALRLCYENLQIECLSRLLGDFDNKTFYIDIRHIYKIVAKNEIVESKRVGRLKVLLPLAEKILTGSSFATYKKIIRMSKLEKQIS